MILTSCAMRFSPAEQRSPVSEEVNSRLPHSHVPYSSVPTAMSPAAVTPEAAYWITLLPVTVIITAGSVAQAATCLTSHARR